MNTFSIAELAQFSGIKAHTIRIWEQRYNVLKPQRNEGNIRSYNGEQLQRLLNIVSLMNESYKISDLCSMSNNELQKHLEQKLTLNQNQFVDHELIVNQLIIAGYEYNQTQFEHLFAHAILKYGFVNTYTNIIYPLLLRIGMMWILNKIPPSQEHFITNIIRKKLLVSIDELPLPKHPKKKWLLFLNEDEYHDIGLLMAYFLIAQAGHLVYYLGANVPLQSLENAVKEINPNMLLYFLVRNNEPQEDLKLIKYFNRKFNSKKIIMVADSNRIQMVKNTANFTRISTLNELTNFINNV